jgi:hypothetical protein
MADQLAFLAALEAPYFEERCIASLDPYLDPQGFANETAAGGHVRYRKGRCFLNFSYLPEDSPRYTLYVSIGLKRRWFSPQPLESIGLWMAPNANDRPEQWLLDFQNAEQLASALAHARVLLDLHARPLWEDHDRLRRLLADSWRAMAREQRDGPPPPPRFKGWIRRSEGR